MTTTPSPYASTLVTQRNWLDATGRIVAWVASLGGLGTILATLVGYYYHRGLVDGLGVPAGLFPISIQDALLLSHGASLLGLGVNGLPWLNDWSWFWWQSLFVAVCFVIGGTIGVISLRRSPRTAPAKRLNRKQLAGVLMLYGVLGGTVAYWLPRVLLVASIFALMLPRFSFDLARTEGHKILARAPCDDQTPCVRIEGDAVPAGTAVIGRIVLSNEHWLAVRTAETLLVLPTEHLRLTIELKRNP